MAEASVSTFSTLFPHRHDLSYEEINRKVPTKRWLAAPHISPKSRERSAIVLSNIVVVLVVIDWLAGGTHVDIVDML